MDFSFLDIFGKDYCDNIDKDCIRQFEEDYEISFPEDYKEFQLRFGGGTLFDFECSILEEFLPDEVLPLDVIADFVNLYDCIIVKENPPYIFYEKYKILPIITNGGCDCGIFIGVGKDNNGIVYYCNILLPPEEITISNDNSFLNDGHLHIISNSFKEFIESITIKKFR